MSKQNIVIQQAKIKATAIEKEAEIKFQNKKIKLKEEEIELKKQYEREERKLIKNYEEKALQLEKQEIIINQQLKQIEEKSKNIAMQQSDIIKSQMIIDGLKEQYKQKQEEIVNALSNYSSLSKEEAKSMLLVHLEDSLIIERANLIRRYEQEAKEEAKRKANYIIALATSRYAGEYSAEKLINVVSLPDDEMKGRIIGKDGRNIKTLENITGVDVLIDDTPNTITLSSFNLYRRSIALNTLNLLIEDGRIHPARIEEIYKKCEAEMEQNILNDGENVVIDLGLGYMNVELKKLIGKMKYRASFGQNALSHSIEVAHLSGLIAGELDGDEILAKRAGLLHDIGKSLTHELGGNHVTIGYDLARKYKEHPVVINAILAHHGNEEAKSIESAAVCAADAISGARPGARKEVLENFLKRVQNLEKIALNHLGVKQAYAINAGREIRVIVKSDQVNDKEAAILAREIAKEIELNLQYPGEIKVNVIREIRATQYAR
ncbi:ribonuclease Y [Helicobacter sp. MIT 14-3879]|uniref:ribonuclease Y n=1 Tax=Helicobacter sp. MIT 14-3879 TaxID=2040649 RepID=UPI0028689516|nr:ribonuclease Y [Helicobacter sp. MIT 14-3879]